MLEEQEKLILIHVPFALGEKNNLLKVCRCEWESLL